MSKIPHLRAASSAELTSGGAGLHLHWSFGTSPFGNYLLVYSERGICRLAFIEKQAAPAVLAELTQRWPAATLVEEAAAPDVFTSAEHVPALWLRMSAFQHQVWQALLRIPPGQVVSYQALATELGRPQAARAVARAVGSNPIAYLIPCHRVIRKDASLGGYRWGPERKKALLDWERNLTTTS